MALSSQQIVKLLSNLDKPGVAGHAEALRRANRQGMSTSLSSNQMHLLDDLRGTSAPAAGPGYLHPAAMSNDAGGRRSPLTAAQIAWLQQLPQDPAQVSHTDAVEVFRLLDSAKPPVNETDPATRAEITRAHAADLPLLRSIADPLREFHDRNQASADLAGLAQRAPREMPASALGALADAISAESNQLEPDEAVARAGNMLGDVSQERARTHAQAVWDAQQRLDAVDRSSAARTAVTR